MSTLLLRLAAPLQAWGVDAKFDRRGTERLPTKSGVVGMVAAALGRKRNESLDDLSSLRFGVRVEREGSLLRDFHTAKSEAHAYATTRYYLSDAVFLVGLEGAENTLSTIAHALQFPAFPLFLGRRSCPPEGQVSLGVRTGMNLLQALRAEPWLVNEWAAGRESAEVHLRIVTDAADNTGGVFFQRDVPLSFDQRHRQYGFRRVQESAALLMPNPSSKRAAKQPLTTHDAMAEL